MITVYLYYPKPLLRDFMSRYLIEMYPNCYSGTMPAGTAEELKNLCLNYCKGAIFQLSSDTEQGFILTSCGNSPYEIRDFDGIQLLSTPAKRLSIWERLWAKSDPYVPLVQHMNDVGTTLKYMLTKSAYQNLGLLMAEIMHLSVEDAADTLAFFAALHDIGKAHPAFQVKAKNNTPVYNRVLRDLYRNGYLHDVYEIDGFRHEIYSSELIKKWCDDNGLGENETECITKVVAFHHVKSTKTWETDIDRRDNPDAWQEMQQKIFEHIKEKFPPKIFQIANDDKTKFMITFYGLLLLCDQTCSKFSS